MNGKNAKKDNETIDVSSLTYEQAYQLIESTVGRMSEPNVPLEELMELYEKAVQLGAHCDKLLKGYEARMEKVSAETIGKEVEADREEDDEPPFDVDNEDDEF